MDTVRYYNYFAFTENLKHFILLSIAERQLLLIKVSGIIYNINLSNTFKAIRTD